jgi:hypothetical protein
MEVYRPSEGRQQKSQTAPQEPNLVPIMNLFVTIIPFMLLLIVVSQVALVALNFSQAAGGGGQGDNGGGGEEDKKIEIHLMAREHSSGLFPGMEIRDPGNPTVKLPVINGYYDFVGLNNVLENLRAKNTDPAFNEITVLVHPEVLYDTLIRTIDLCKQNGFTNVQYTAPKAVYYY